MGIKLNQILYKVNKTLEIVEEVIVIGIYNLEKVNQDDDYFFNTPNQLVSYTQKPSEHYSDEFYNNNINSFLKTGIFKGPIQKYTFKDIFDTFTEVFLTKEKAEETLKSYLKFAEANKEKQKKIGHLKDMINELEGNN